MEFILKSSNLQNFFEYLCFLNRDERRSKRDYALQFADEMSKEAVRFMPRKCRICNNDRRKEIEHALLRGVSHRVVEQQFTVSRGAVARHLKHVATALTEARKLREIEGGTSILLQLRDLNLQADQLKARADRTGDYRTALAALREKTRLVELEARLTGALDEKPETKIFKFTFDAETARRITETFLARHLGVNPT